MRSLHPALALLAFICLPMTLADDRPKPMPAAAEMTPEPQREMRVIRVQHASAVNVARQLNSIFAVGVFLRGGPLTVTHDDRINGIVLSAAAPLLEKALSVIEQLDVPATSDIQTQTLHLKHAEAKHLCETLRETLSQRARSTAGAMPFVVADERSGSLLLTGTAAELELVKSLIEALDVSAPGVGREVPGATQARISVYEMTVNRERVAELRSDALAREPSTDNDFAKRLSGIGRARLLYSLDQAVDLNENAAVSVMSQVPMPGETRMTKEGRKTASFEYEDLGFIAHMRGEYSGPGRTDGKAEVRIEISAMTDCEMASAAGIEARKKQKIVQSYNGPFTAGRPMVLLSLEAAGSKDTATAYITRIELTGDATARG